MVPHGARSRPTPGQRSGLSPAAWRHLTRFGAAVLLIVTVCVLGELQHIYFDRRNLPDVGPLLRFELPTIGHIYDARGESLVELARQHRHITEYEEMPPVVRQAILATEDKRFFSHDGVDFTTGPRIVSKVRLTNWGTRVTFPQGGSTITQQLVRGVFLQDLTVLEKRNELQSRSLIARGASMFIGTRNTNRFLRKREEIRLSVWLERQMRREFGSKRRAKEEILARYASFVYMGRGQYGFTSASEHYFGRPLSSLTVKDADLAAMLAGVMKAPRDYAPTSANADGILQRRNQILNLMARRGFITSEQSQASLLRPLPTVVQRAKAQLPAFPSSAVVEHVIDELKTGYPDLGVEELLNGRIQVFTTVDARMQKIVADALEHGIKRYEDRRPKSRGLLQGSVVVLSNRDGGILAEVGGRQVYKGRSVNYSDLNRVRRSLRQPGSTMKPIVYLAAFQSGGFTLDTIVPDEPISLPGARQNQLKSISNYDGVFKGPIPIRQALAESRNAVAVWLTSQIGIDAVLQTSRRLGVETPLQRYATTALGASEVNLLELATAYRTMATGTLAQPYLVRRIVKGFDDTIEAGASTGAPLGLEATALDAIQEGLRGVVLLPSGTGHSLASRAFPIPVMGKTGTTNDFKDALFVGSTYGPDGITVAIRMGFDDNHTLGSGETGGRVALPVFQEVMLNVYKLLGKPPAFPRDMDQRITEYVTAAAASAEFNRMAAEVNGAAAVVGVLAAGDLAMMPGMIPPGIPVVTELKVPVTETRMTLMTEPKIPVAAHPGIPLVGGPRTPVVIETRVPGVTESTTKKCAHAACKCVVSKDGSRGDFCGDHCKIGGVTGEPRCDCGHPGCGGTHVPLGTARQR